MIDDPLEVDRLIAAMRASLPLPVEPSLDVRSLLRRQVPARDDLSQCCVDQVDYAGDEGGIVCRLDFGTDLAMQAYIVSITHLRFARTQPLSSAIAAYQKRRIKRLRRLGRA